MKKTTITIFAPGDSSVGIPYSTVTIQFNYDILLGYDREVIRKDYAEFFSEQFDTAEVGVRFEDECPDCGKRFYNPTTNKCSFKHCIRNQPDDTNT